MMLSRLSKLQIVNFSSFKKKKGNSGVNGNRENLANSLTSRIQEGVERFPLSRIINNIMFSLFFLVSWGVKKRPSFFPLQISMLVKENSIY